MNTIVSEPTHTAEISATKIDCPHERMGFLFKMFGNYLVHGEAEVFTWMRALAKSYTGGFWDFFSLSNGGHFMAPSFQRVQIQAPNDFEGEVSGEAAGLIASLYALSHLAYKISQKGCDTDALTEQYIALRAYAVEHPEREMILAAID